MGNLQIIEKALAPNGHFMGELKRILPTHVKPDFVAKTFLTTLKHNQKLQSCSTGSLEKCLMGASEYGLPIDGKLASLLPFKGTATLVIGYQGMIKLMYQSGLISSYIAEKVCENDIFDIDYGSENPLTFKPCIRGDRGEVIGFISIARFKNGGELSFKYMTKDECLVIGANHSPTFDRADSPWKKHPDAMCLKTVIRQHSKFLPQSAQIFDQISEDGEVMSFKDDETVIQHESQPHFEPEVERAPTPQQSPIQDDHIPHITVKDEAYFMNLLANAKTVDDAQNIIIGSDFESFAQKDNQAYYRLMEAVSAKKSELQQNQ
ncbi:MAG: recombinase RecT [Pseudomonadota bacterium]